MKKVFNLFILFYLISPAIFCVESEESVKKRLEQLEKDVLDLQINSMLSKVMISGEFFNTYNKIDTSNNSHGKKNHQQDNFIGNLIFNVNSSIGNDVQVYTSLYSSYFYGADVLNTTEEPREITDPTMGYSLNVVKAYIDYKVLQEKFIASIGRMPTMYGPPSHLYDLTNRSGTYPLLGFSLPFDGMALTWNLKPTFSLNDDFRIRAIYAIINRGNANDLDIGVTSQTGTNNLAENTYISSLMIDYGTQRLAGIASDLYFILQGYYGKMRTFPSMKAFGVLDSRFPGDNDLYEIYSDKKDLLDLYGIIAHLEFNNFMKLPLNFYTTYKRNWATSHADVFWKIISDGAGGSGGPVGTTGRLGGYMVEGKDTGNSVLVGSLYKLSSKNGLGAEYLYASPGIIGTTFYTKTSTNFYNTIGEGYHVFYTQSLKADRMNFRLGYMNALSKKELQDVIFQENHKRTITYYAHLGLRF